MKNLFEVLPMDFFKPLTSKYRREYADCILLIFNTFRSELSYGVNREIVVKVLEQYFEIDDTEMTFDERTYVLDAREKANAVIASLKNCGWLEYEQERNHQLNVVLIEYTIPVIESMNQVLSEEETEYQGIISQIHASLQNEDLYSRPYEMMIKGVKENTEHLMSELKKLNVNIKRHMEKQTGEMSAADIIEQFFQYHQTIGSKAYLRMKTSDNISYFRSSILEKIEEIMEDTDLMKRATQGMMELEQGLDADSAYDRLVMDLLDIKSMFYQLDEMIAEIDRKHTQYMKNAVMRARFQLATGNNIEGKLSRILGKLAEEYNEMPDEQDELMDEAPEEMAQLCNFYVQGYVSPESLRTIPVMRNTELVSLIEEETAVSLEERSLYKEALQMKNRTRFSKSNINEYVTTLLAGKERISVCDIPVESRRDLIRIIYISIYAGNPSSQYEIHHTGEKIERLGCILPLFDVVKR